MTFSNANQRSDTILYRKRDSQGNLLESSDIRDIFVPFKSPVPAGHSTFEIPVPRTFLNRTFSFDNLMLIPDLYTDQAAEYDLETDEEMKQVLSFEMYIKVDFDPRNLFYPGQFVGSAGTINASRLCKNANIFIESKKPVGTKHMGGFFDWIDLRFNNVEGEGFDEYMQSMAIVFYGVPYDASVHYNSLPQSARSVKGSNNYLFPTERSEDLAENIRFRLWIAPNTQIYFSTSGHLFTMGFTAHQIGSRKGRNQFIMQNDSKMAFLPITAEDVTTFKLKDKATDFKMHLEILEPYFISESNYVGLTRREAMKNENFETAIKNTLVQFEDQCNLQFGFSYEPTEKKFSFSFPQNIIMKNMRFVLVPELSERLGFDLNTDIGENNRVGKTVENINTKETENRARALAHDTGIIIVSDFHSGSISTSGINEKYMGALYPTETGTMVIHFNEVCNPKPTMTLRDDIMTPSVIPITFLLSKFLEKNKLVNLIWRESFTMMGTLRGVANSQNSNK